MVLNVLTSDQPPQWGEPGCPLLPVALRRVWAAIELPRWFVQEAALEEGAKVGFLGAEMWERLPILSTRLERYVIGLIELRRGEILTLPALSRPWSADLVPKDVPWQVRTINCLARAGLLDDGRRLSMLTFGDLFAIRGMGAKSVLDFACVSEAALDWVSEIGQGTAELAAELLDEEWIDLVSEEDPRFAPLLPPGTGTVLQRLDDATAAEATPTAVAALASSLDGVVAKIKEIESLPLDLALRDYLFALSGLNDDRLAALAARLGWDGKPPRTLEESAQLIGVTRERIRQLQTKVVSRFPSHPIFMPALDAALACISEAGTIDTRRVSKLLVEKGISSVPFHPASVLAAVGACGRAAPFEIERVGKGHRVITRGGFSYAGEIISMARRRASSVGVANVTDVAGLVSIGESLNGDYVNDILTSCSDAEFLDQEWFWVPSTKPERNRLYNVTRRMLAVAEPLDVTTIREGLRRHYPVRNINIVPPKSVLSAFYEEHPGFKLDGDGRVSSSSPIDYRDELGATERVLVEVFRRSPTGVLDRASLEDACERGGMNLNTLSVYTTYSPVLEHLGIDLWALRGVPVDPAAVEAVRRANAQRPREKRVQDYGWTTGGRLWLAVRLPRHPEGGLVIGIPAAIDQYVIDRRFLARSEDGAEVGTIVIDQKGTSWGYGPYLSRYGADEGDILRIEFDLVEGSVTLRIGGEELMDEAPAA